MYNLLMNSARKKICVVTCYKYPDYVRGEVIREAVRLNPDFELISVKNRHKGLLRYPEVFLRLLHARLFKRPDVYLVTFRGYEILPIARIISIGKPLVFDEFINLVEWAVHEHKKLKKDSMAAKLLRYSYGFWLKRTRMILTDTKSHASYSAKLMGIPAEKYKVLPVGADEKLFKISKQPAKTTKNTFDILYYGNMLPLHGAEYVLEAAIKMANQKNIHFTLIGGKKEMKQKVDEAISQGANIRYIDRVPLLQLPSFVGRSDLCLGGPFGKTVQSGMVITGKTFQFMSMSKPALIGNNKESGIFRDKQDVLAVDQADADGLADAIRWAADNRAKLKEIGNRGHKLYQEKFSAEKISSKLSDLLG